MRAEYRRQIAIGLLIGIMALLNAVSLMAEDEKPQKPRPAGSVAAEKPQPPVDLDQLEDGVVTGTLVRASDGSPVADATVILHTGGSNKTKSDAQGRFRLEKIKPRTWAYPLFAHQGNLVTKVIDVSSLPTSDPAVAKFAPVRLEMVEGKQARFLVTSEITGKPIVGAAIRFGYPDRRLITTDQQGQAMMQGLMPKPLYGEGYEVTIEAEGHARSAPQLKLSPSKLVTEFEAALTTGGIVQGTVLDADGKPVPEVDVYYRIDNGVGFHGDAFRSDAEGKFRHRFLPLDVPIEVTAQKKNYVSQKQDVTLVAKQREQLIQFTMPGRPKGGSVAGVITDEAGKPIAAADVANYGNNGDDKHETKTDAQGKFVIHDLFKGTNSYEVCVSVKGFAPQLVEVDPGTEQVPTEIAVALKPGHVVRGRVVLDDGKPAKGALVSIRSGAFRFGLGKTITVDKDGGFQFDSLPDDVRFDVQMRGYVMLHNFPIKLDDVEPVTVTLEPPGVIRGRVIDDETGRPVPQFRIRLAFSSIRQPGDRQGSLDGNWTNPGVTFESEKGEFIVKPLTNGMPVDLIVEQEGYQRAAFPRAVAAKESEAEEVLISLERLRAENQFTLAGQLLDHAGKPKAKAQLRLIVSAIQPTGIDDNKFNWSLIKSGQLSQKSYCEQYLSGETDAEGRFKFPNVLPGNYLQLAYWGAGVPKGKSLDFEVTKAGGNEDVTIQLPEPATIRGTIVRENLPEAGLVHLASEGPGYEIELKADQSTFEFVDLPPGRYTLGINTKRFRFTENGNTFFKSNPLAHKNIELRAGQVEEIEFTKPDPQLQKR